jgi:hypothetical protein
MLNYGLKYKHNNRTRLEYLLEVDAVYVRKLKIL